MKNFNLYKGMAMHLLLAAALAQPMLVLAEPAQIYLVRHGEKQAAGKDPELTAQGKARAQNVATMLRKAGVEAVFSSQTTRTIQTAQPMAQAAGVEVQTYDPSKPEAMVARVKALKGGAVLVVGHSNTVPALVRMFGGVPGTDIADDEFDRVYQLHVGADGKVTTVLLSSLPAN
ncbi:phosphoglycerate mutase family protein [Massilia sp. R2A-15]|uniref:phosphoglycerate mutase family protein n=1 Tax=Massilia sp. R2A-15 TaxID=3064278 RepID=UPI0027326096|nr:phosphoglycerate mutase family protein [Massilia sp. R2A-15]WLI89310.1 phosphoglycerate mutase family protein [Massilia sp. R2A-15]